jgi:hypothetical protein
MHAEHEMYCMHYGSPEYGVRNLQYSCQQGPRRELFNMSMRVHCQTAVGYKVHTEIQNRSVKHRFIIIARVGPGKERRSAYKLVKLPTLEKRLNTLLRRVVARPTDTTTSALQTPKMVIAVDSHDCGLPTESHERCRDP